MSSKTLLATLPSGNTIQVVSDYGDMHIREYSAKGRALDIALGYIANTNCCGIDEFSGFQNPGIGDSHVEKLKALFENFGKIPIACSAYVLNLVHNWKSAEPLEESLRKGGWIQVMTPRINPNSKNTISTWMFQHDEEALKNHKASDDDEEDEEF